MPSRKQSVSKLRKGLRLSRACLQELASKLQWAFSPKNYLNYGLYEDIKRRQRLKEEREYLRYLQRRKLIETKKIGQRLMVRLTDRGWTAALRDKVKCTQACRKSGFCFVTFDIPEKERLVREELRYFLKECGFQRLQDSVWMTNRDVIEPLKELLQRRKLEKWIRIIVGDIVSASPLDRLAIRKIMRSQNSAVAKF